MKFRWSISAQNHHVASMLHHSGMVHEWYWFVGSQYSLGDPIFTLTVPWLAYLLYHFLNLSLRLLSQHQFLRVWNTRLEYLLDILLLVASAFEWCYLTELSLCSHQDLTHLTRCVPCKCVNKSLSLAPKSFHILSKKAFTNRLRQQKTQLHKLTSQLS